MNSKGNFMGAVGLLVAWLFAAALLVGAFGLLVWLVRWVAGML